MGSSLPGREHVRRDARFRSFQGLHLLRAFLRRTLSIAVLVALDLSALTLGLLAALASGVVFKGQHVDFGAIWLEARRVLPVAAITVILVFARNGLYRDRDRRGRASTIISSIAVSTVIVAAVIMADGNRFTSYYNLVAAFVIVSIACVALRAAHGSLTSLIFDILRAERRVVLAGSPGLTAEIADSLQRSQGRESIPYRVVGQFGLTGNGNGEISPGLRGMIGGGEVDEVILAGSMGADAPLLELLEYCRVNGVQVRMAPTATELLSHSLRAVAAPGLPLFAVHPPVLSGGAFFVKRAFDMIVGTLILILVSPILAIAALAIKIEDGGPILFRSRRVGVEETRFDCLKLRTMSVDAEQRQAALEDQNEADGALFKIKSDPRVTRVGRILRRFSIDELTQLFNVLRGEMSLVGPRPLPERDFDLLDDVHKRRYLVLPGMTGLWQVSGRSDLSFDELVRLDFSYIERWSVWLDLGILVRTIPAVLFRRGAF